MQIYKRFLRILALILLASMLPSGALSAGTRKAIVTAESVDVRMSPKAGSSLLGTLDKGTEVTVTGVSGKIVKIKYAGRTGYVKKSALRLIKDEKTASPSKTPKLVPTPKPTPAPSKAQSAAASVLTRKTTVRALAYRERDTKCKKRTVVNKGTAFVILSSEGEFYKVKRGGQVAYMLKTAFEEKAVAPAPARPETSVAPTPAPTSRAVTRAVSQKCIVYKKASKASKALKTLAAGDKVGVIQEGKTFFKVMMDGKIGYVAAKAFLEAPSATPVPSATPAPAATPKPSSGGAPSRSVNQGEASTVIAAAMAQLGKRYVYGTSGPDTFDCSGFTYFAYKKVGVSLAHSAQSVGYGSGQKVDRAHLERGDIVCFNTISDSDLSDHVGIYLGNNQFVHASSGQGRVVVSTLSGYYSENFSWGRRVI